MGTLPCRRLFLDCWKAVVIFLSRLWQVICGIFLWWGECASDLSNYCSNCYVVVASSEQMHLH